MDAINRRVAMQNLFSFAKARLACLTLWLAGVPLCHSRELLHCALWRLLC